MQTRLLRLAIVAVASLLLAACQTPSLPSFSETKDAVKPVEDLRVQLLIEFCRGQIPQSISTAEYNTWPEAAKDYATKNVAQWLAADCKL